MCRYGGRITAALAFCFVLGHFALLYGIAGGIHKEDAMLIKKLATPMSTVLMIFVTPIGIVFIVNIIRFTIISILIDIIFICIAIKEMLLNLRRRVLQVLNTLTSHI